jgi:hypothetical protein
MIIFSWYRPTVFYLINLSYSGNKHGCCSMGRKQEEDEEVMVAAFLKTRSRQRDWDSRILGVPLVALGVGMHHRESTGISSLLLSPFLQFARIQSGSLILFHNFSPCHINLQEFH